MANNKKMKISIIIIIIAIILVDQITKVIAINNSYTIGIVSFNYKAQEKANIEGIVTSGLTDIIVFIIIIKFLKEQDKNMKNKVKISLALILGGEISNFIDKIWNRDVIEFIHIGKLPVLNVAYIVFVIGWILFLILMVQNTLEVNKEIKQINEQKAMIGREKK